MSKKIPWQQLLYIANTVLKIPPPLFWQLTFKEYRALLAPFDYITLTKGQLFELQKKFPD